MGHTLQPRVVATEAHGSCAHSTTIKIEAETEELFRKGSLVAPAGEEDASWRDRSAAELLSAAGAAPQAEDRVAGSGVQGEVSGGVLFNPEGYSWTEDACNVHWSEHARLVELRDAWYGKASVGHGAVK